MIKSKYYAILSSWRTTMEKVLKLIKEKQFFSPGCVVGVACSGGSDSMALLHFLNSNRDKLDIDVMAIHVDHGTRDNDVRDALFVQDYCKENRIRFYKFKVKDSLKKKTKGKGLEQTCREARYKIFEDLRDKGMVDKIALAHHQNDQAETVLLHILRGSGLNGASGMDYSRNDFYIRPFLDLSKEEILTYIYQNQIPFVEDETNSDITIARNFLRHKILPELQKVWPNTVENLCNFAKICKEDDETLRSFMSFDAILHEKNMIKIPRSYFNYRISFVKRMILDCFDELGLGQVVEKKHVDLIVEFAKNGQNGSKINLPDNVVVYKEYEYITLTLKKVKRETQVEWPFKKGLTHIDEYGSIKVKKTDQKEPVVGSLLVDVDKIPAEAKWRFFKEGDFVEKFGGAGVVKIKKYLSDKKIPLRLRSVLPLLCVENEVLVVANIDISEKLRVDEKTKNACLIEFNIKNWV